MAKKNKQKLSEKLVRELKPKQKSYRVWDTVLPYLLVDILPSGRKTYRAYYRHEGKIKWVTIGRCGSVKLSKARELTKKTIGRLAEIKNSELPINKPESDPSGKSQHEPGAKNDSGKVRVGLVFEGFARALWAVCEVGTEGAAKYSDNGWLEVEAGKERYTDAQLRHFLKGAMGEEIDPDFDLLHMAHEAWNSLAKLELKLREIEAKNADQEQNVSMQP